MKSEGLQDKHGKKMAGSLWKPWFGNLAFRPSFNTTAFEFVIVSASWFVILFVLICTVGVLAQSSSCVWAQTFLPFYINLIIIIIIAFKGAIRDFLQSPHSATNCLQHVRSSGPGAIVCKSHATHRVLITCKCHVTDHLVGRDSSAIKFDRIEIAFIWALFYWLNH